jgi:hypothetical protein
MVDVMYSALVTCVYMIKCHFNAINFNIRFHL